MHMHDDKCDEFARGIVSLRPKEPALVLRRVEIQWGRRRYESMRVIASSCTRNVQGSSQGITNDHGHMAMAWPFRSGSTKTQPHSMRLLPVGLNARRWMAHGLWLCATGTAHNAVKALGRPAGVSALRPSAQVAWSCYLSRRPTGRALHSAATFKKSKRMPAYWMVATATTFGCHRGVMAVGRTRPPRTLRRALRSYRGPERSRRGRCIDTLTNERHMGGERDRGERKQRLDRESSRIVRTFEMRVVLAQRVIAHLHTVRSAVGEQQRVFLLAWSACGVRLNVHVISFAGAAASRPWQAPQMGRCRTGRSSTCSCDENDVDGLREDQLHRMGLLPGVDGGVFRF